MSTNYSSYITIIIHDHGPQPRLNQSRFFDYWFLWVIRIDLDPWTRKWNHPARALTVTNREPPRAAYSFSSSATCIIMCRFRIFVRKRVAEANARSRSQTWVHITIIFTFLFSILLKQLFTRPSTRKLFSAQSIAIIITIFYTSAYELRSYSLRTNDILCAP